ncbi:hypothetical protein Q9Q99_11290 [Curtobacterium flaccumfaciens]|nr:hypothetical protein Q9Q99_11290 [Curtobacterium flaccumfaciens]
MISAASSQGWDTPEVVVQLSRFVGDELIEEARTVAICVELRI